MSPQLLSRLNSFRNGMAICVGDGNAVLYNKFVPCRSYLQLFLSLQQYDREVV